MIAANRSHEPGPDGRCPNCRPAWWLLARLWLVITAVALVMVLALHALVEGLTR